MGEKYTDKSDIYSLGVVLYFMYFKEFPYKSLGLIKKIENLQKGVELKFKKGVEISESIQKLIKKMMAYTENDRISWTELFDVPLIKQVADHYKHDLNVFNGDEAEEESDRD